MAVYYDEPMRKPTGPQRLEEQPDYYRMVWEKWAGEVKSHMTKPLDYEDACLQIVEGKRSGIPMPFEPRFKFRPGETSLIVGSSGHGKSLWSGQLALYLAQAFKQKTCLISLEMSGERTLVRMMRQCFERNPQPGDVNPWLRWAGRYFTIYDRIATVSVEEVCGAVLAASMPPYSCQFVIVDNLMRCVKGEGDFDGQKSYAEHMSDIAKDRNIHIATVAHLTKRSDPKARPTRADMRGASAVWDTADNAMFLWRNGVKDEKRQELERSGSKNFDYQYDQDNADSVLIVGKQRNGDWTGEIPLWYSQPAAAFCPSVARVVPPLCPFSPSAKEVA